MGSKPEPELAQPRNRLKQETPAVDEVEGETFAVPSPGRERLYGRFDVPPTMRTIANVQRQGRVIE